MEPPSRLYLITDCWCPKKYAYMYTYAMKDHYVPVSQFTNSSYCYSYIHCHLTQESCFYSPVIHIKFQDFFIFKTINLFVSERYDGRLFYRYKQTSVPGIHR